MRVVLDTNIFVSGIFFRPSNPGKILDLWLGHKFDLIISGPLYKEILETSQKIAERLEARPTLFLKLEETLKEYAYYIFVEPQTHLCRDVKDNLVLDTAVQAGANFIVTGDKDLLILKSYQNIPILTPAEFLRKILK